MEDGGVCRWEAMGVGEGGMGSEYVCGAGSGPSDVWRANAVVNTKSVKEFRAVRLNSAKEVIAEAERIVASERAGTLRITGNWTVGQTFGHIATWIEFALDGYPPDVKPPALVKFVLRTFMKKKFLRGPMPRGVRIPGMPQGTLGTEPMTTEDGLARLRRAWERLSTTAPTVANPIFGVVPHDEWIAMNLRHTELHFGYLHP